MAKLGLFSTMTGAGSRALVTTIARACRDGDVPGTAVGFLFVNREVGESPLTDESVVAIGAEFAFPIVRASAVRFRTEERQAARAAAAAGDEAPLWAWRDEFYASYRDRLPSTDLDLLLGDMWVWGRQECAERRGLNLHPALPTGPLGKMWFEVIWDLIAVNADVSGVMLHRVTPAVDRGPVATFCRYPLRGPELDPLWALLPACLEDRLAVINSQRLLKREATHPLFHALRQVGLAREMPLMLATARAVAEGRLRLGADGVSDGSGRFLAGGLELTAEVEQAVANTSSRLA
jgi:phosphoribosylglycinamide formyltransferase 1